MLDGENVEAAVKKCQNVDWLTLFRSAVIFKSPDYLNSIVTF